MHLRTSRLTGFARALFAAILLSMLLPALAGASEIDFDQIRVSPDPATGSVAITVATGLETRPWRSLTSVDESGRSISRHLGFRLGRDGDVSLPLVDREGVGAEPATRLLTDADGQWRLDWRLEPSAEPYRLRLWVDLERLGDDSLRPEYLYLQLGPGLGETPLEGLGIATGLYSYVEGLVHDAGGTQRVRLGETGERELLVTEQWSAQSWAGLGSRYFALLVSVVEGSVPDRVEFELPGVPAAADIEARYLPQALIGLPVSDLEVGQRQQWQFEVFSGPRARPVLQGEQAGDYSELLFHGLWRWMRALSLALLWLLELIYSLIPSWGLAICLLAVLVRVLLYPFARWALASQQRFAEVQRQIEPELRRIKQRYKGGEQSERILRLYEKHQVSPLAGLKPLLIVLVQIPVFVALFHVLGSAYELSDASFLWIGSLAEPDRLFAFGVDLPFFGAWFNLLPVLMALTTLATIKLSPAPSATDADRRRQNLFLGLMALAFFLLFYPFPAGMVLYWTMANLLHIAQAWMFRPTLGRMTDEVSK